MLCEKCNKRQATTHIKSVVNGVKKEYNLCAECAAAEGFGANSLTGMLASMFGDISKYNTISDGKKCSVCGASFSDIAHSGKVGCSECYNTFYDELLPYLKRVHGSLNHVGKVPNSAPLVVTPKKTSIDDLRKELARLVAEENYEQAALVRDRIKEMEAGK